MIMIAEVFHHIRIARFDTKTAIVSSNFLENVMEMLISQENCMEKTGRHSNSFDVNGLPKPKFPQKYSFCGTYMYENGF